MSSCDCQSIQEQFSAAGIRCTKQRLALYDALMACQTHPTAEELRGLVQEDVPGVSLATVYNTLDALVDAGLARRLEGAGPAGSARFDAGSDQHPHIRCSRSGRVADVPDDLARLMLDALPDATLADLEERLGFRISQVHLEFVGEFDGK